ncbi:hypothetical protein TorRG33x02_095160 [Trema orientale]|uniref:Uncharacterized protein n=1 Tax=Trema orientale TaxID=63057 RepID=A0A2P5FAC7_TREOI|nr:hypothetical protein TorRG33x02_095160 [Trema orientale]
MAQVEDGVREVFPGDAEVGEERLGQVIDDVSVGDKWAIILVEMARKFEKRETGCSVEGKWVLVRKDGFVAEKEGENGRNWASSFWACRG